MAESTETQTADIVDLRTYRTEDLQAMVALDRLCFAPEFLFGHGAMRRYAEAADSHAVVAERGTELVGFAIGQMEGEGRDRVGYCVTLDVSPSERRSGLGGTLLGQLERWAEAEGATEMALHVWVGNAGARRFYERRGYRVLREEQDFYGPGTHALVCRKWL